MKVVLTSIIAEIREIKRTAPRKIVRIELTPDEARDLHSERWAAGEQEAGWCDLMGVGSIVFEGIQITWPPPMLGRGQIHADREA
jgi:hypothetical protein